MREFGVNIYQGKDSHGLPSNSRGKDSESSQKAQGK